MSEGVERGMDEDKKRQRALRLFRLFCCFLLSIVKDVFAESFLLLLRSEVP